MIDWKGLYQALIYDGSNGMDGDAPLVFAGRTPAGMKAKATRHRVSRSQVQVSN